MYLWVICVSFMFSIYKCMFVFSLVFSFCVYLIVVLFVLSFVCLPPLLSSGRFMFLTFVSNDMKEWGEDKDAHGWKIQGEVCFSKKFGKGFLDVVKKSKRGGVYTLFVFYWFSVTIFGGETPGEVLFYTPPHNYLIPWPWVHLWVKSRIEKDPPTFDEMQRVENVTFCRSIKVAAHKLRFYSDFVAKCINIAALFKDIYSLKHGEMNWGGFAKRSCFFKLNFSLVQKMKIKTRLNVNKIKFREISIVTINFLLVIKTVFQQKATI